MKERVLVLGSGRDPKQRIAISPAEGDKLFSDNFKEVVTVDLKGNPTYRIDVRNTPWTIWPENTFDEIHAYEVLNLLPFFPIWREMWKVLRPGGLVVATVPHWSSKWAWNDPATLTVYSEEKLWYLNQKKYEEHPIMTDYREDSWRKPFNFEIRHALTTADSSGEPMGFIMVAEKAIDEG